MKTIETSKNVLKNSQFLHLFEKNGVFCLLHSLTLHKVYGGQILKSLFEAFKRPQCVDELVAQLCTKFPRPTLDLVISELRDKGLLVPDNKEDLTTYVGLFERGMAQYPIQHMYFISTTGCNFRCKYCFVEDCERQFVASHMTKEKAKKGLEVFAKLAENANRISLTFYGGEPLLNADVVYFAMRYVRELEKKGVFKKTVDMTLLTNGSLVDEKTVEAILETKTKVSISIDGPECLHDAARIDVQGNNTYSRALAGYRMLQEAGAAPGISCTLTRFNIEHIEEIAKFIATELKPSGMGFNILLPRINGENPVDCPHEFAASQLLSAFKILREYGIYEDRVMRRARPYIECKFHLKDCMGVGGQIVLTPEGKIGPCQALLGLEQYFPLSVDALYSKLSSITSDDIYDVPLFDEWRHRFPLNMKYCADCCAISICGGGCPYASLANHGSIWNVDERVCSQSKQILEWMIWDTYDHFMETDQNVMNVSQAR